MPEILRARQRGLQKSFHKVTLSTEEVDGKVRSLVWVLFRQDFVLLQKQFVWFVFFVRQRQQSVPTNCLLLLLQGKTFLGPGSSCCLSEKNAN
jgi:hypothetical protein